MFNLKVLNKIINLYKNGESKVICGEKKFFFYLLQSLKTFYCANENFDYRSNIEKQKKHLPSDFRSRPLDLNVINLNFRPKTD